MGYTTRFAGIFGLDKPLTFEQGALFHALTEYDNRSELPAGAPDGYCQWSLTGRRDGIVWDGGEKFYDYVDWLRFLINHYLGPWGYVVNGEVTWAGEDTTDTGTITVKDNTVSALSTQERLAAIEREARDLTASLLAALKRCLPAIRMYANDDDCEAAEAAIAKAEGRA